MAAALLERAAVFQIGRDSGCPEAVVAELAFDPAAAARRRTIAQAFACRSTV
jgi:hypothetical protein